MSCFDRLLEFDGTTCLLEVQALGHCWPARNQICKRSVPWSSSVSRARGGGGAVGPVQLGGDVAAIGQADSDDLLDGVRRLVDVHEMSERAQVTESYAIGQWLFDTAQGRFDIDLAKSGIEPQTVSALQGIDDPLLDYPPDRGMRETRDAVAALHGGACSGERAVITAGAQEALYLLYRALLRKEDRIFATTPGWQHVFVACEPDYTDQHIVADGASELIARIFGEAGAHCRSAIGAASLPLNSPVELEAIVELA